ncbi:MAG: hypothetical protein K2L74_07350 [Muribaculaceae bacterium]|nr:hypothetical protein [Muribaculaceae bacterium]MDE6541810.1 hypothetical protein [Muribaculaceae bacterium]
MATDLRQQLERVNAKTTLVMEKYALMQQRLAQARAEIERLNDELRRSRQAAEALELRLEYLTVSHTVASGAEQVEHTKAMIDELVRDIDRCIADLAD